MTSQLLQIKNFIKLLGYFHLTGPWVDSLKESCCRGPLSDIRKGDRIIQMKEIYEDYLFRFVTKTILIIDYKQVI